MGLLFPCPLFWRHAPPPHGARPTRWPLRSTPRTPVADGRNVEQVPQPGGHHSFQLSVRLLRPRAPGPPEPPRYPVHVHVHGEHLAPKSVRSHTPGHLVRNPRQLPEPLQQRRVVQAFERGPHPARACPAQEQTQRGLQLRRTAPSKPRRANDLFYVWRVSANEGVPRRKSAPQRFVDPPRTVRRGTVRQDQKHEVVLRCHRVAVPLQAIRCLECLYDATHFGFSGGRHARGVSS